MKSNTRILRIIPFIILFALLSILGRELYSASPRQSSEAMVGEPVPAFSLPLISNSKKYLTQNSLKGRVTLLNIWASWCGACAAEHPMLMKIQRDYGIPIYGILYRDSAASANSILARKGNPYVAVGNDPNGDVAIDFGIYGTPETYVVAPNGKILYRQVGVMDKSTWEDTIYPLIKKYEGKR